MADKLIGSVDGRGNALNQEQLKQIVTMSVKEMKPGVINVIKDLLKQLGDMPKKNIIVSKTPGLSNVFKDDIEYLNNTLKVINDLISSSSSLIKKIDEELPEVVKVRSNNPNVKLAIGLVSTYMLLGLNGYNVILYYSNLYQKEFGQVTDDPNFAKFMTYYGNIARSFGDTIASLYKTKIKDTIEVIGKLPTSKSSNNTYVSTFMLDYMTKTLKINNIFNIRFISKVLNLMRADKKKMKSINTGAMGLLATNSFIGNPIYHIRMLLVDWEVNKYEKLKDEKRLAELKLNELMMKRTGQKDEKLEQQIKYYENKIAQLEEKIRLIVDEADNRYNH